MSDSYFIKYNSTSPSVADWVDTFFGNRNGQLEKFEKDQFLNIVNTGHSQEVFDRADMWEDISEIRPRFDTLLQGSSERDFAVALAKDSSFLPAPVSDTLFHSAWMVPLSEGADLRSVTVYSYPELGYKVLYPGMMLKSLTEAAGKPPNYDVVRFSRRYPVRIDKGWWGSVLWGVTHLKIRLEQKMDPASPFGLIPLLAGGTRDLFVPSGSMAKFYESDFNDTRCLPQGSELCATSQMTQDLIDAALPTEESIITISRSKDLVYIPFPIGNVMKQALFDPAHQVDVEQSLKLLEKFLEETEKDASPPRIVINTMGRARAFTAVDELGNNIEGRNDCRTYKVRAYSQKYTPESAMKKQEDDLCPITEADIDKIDRDIEDSYNVKLFELQKKYPNFAVVDLRDFFESIEEQGYYNDPETGGQISFSVDDTVDIDGIHFTMQFQPHLARMMTSGLNTIFGINLTMDYTIPALPPWLGNSLSEPQRFYLCLAEESRRNTYIPEAQKKGNGKLFNDCIK